jgi:hypothetical protein
VESLVLSTDVQSHLTGGIPYNVNKEPKKGYPNCGKFGWQPN